MQLSVDLVETDDSFNLYADVPGLSKSDLKVCNLTIVVLYCYIALPYLVLI